MTTHWINYEHRRVKRVLVYTLGNNHIDGFRFYDKHPTYLDLKTKKKPLYPKPFFEIGAFTSGAHDIVVQDNEVIIGVKAKQRKNCPAIYSDF